LKRRAFILGLLFLMPSLLSPQPSDFPKLTGPCLGQKPPGRVPEIFAPGVISFPETKEFACAFSPDGKEFYFTSVKTTQRIMYSKMEEGGWSRPRPAEFSEGFFAHEPHVTFDNRWIFWWWANKNNPGIYYAERIQTGWSEAKYAGPGHFISSSRDGNFYVGAPRAESWSRVTLTDGRFVEYEELPDLIKYLRPRYDRIWHPCIAPDGSYLIFDVEGGSHMFVSFNENDGTWSEPTDLTEHGFSRDDGITSISPDGKYLFFDRDKDIYWVEAKVIEELRPK